MFRIEGASSLKIPDQEHQDEKGRSFTCDGSALGGTVGGAYLPWYTVVVIDRQQVSAHLYFTPQSRTNKC
jgi:hypothetical protein